MSVRRRPGAHGPTVMTGRIARASLAAAIQATFETRGTALPASTPLGFTADFYELPAKQTQRRAFLGKSGLKADSSLRQIIEIVEAFVMPVVSDIGKKDFEARLWKAGGPWKKLRRA